MGKEKKAFPLRLDPELYRSLERWASDEFRSVNGHIEFLLREALSRAGRLPQPRNIPTTPHSRPASEEEQPE